MDQGALPGYLFVLLAARCGQIVGQIVGNFVGQFVDKTGAI
jgi:hypothetical protein